MSQFTIGLTNLPAYLEDVKIKHLPNSVYYVANFISEAEEDAILNRVGVVIVHKAF
jgi:hypothetical protein